MAIPCFQLILLLSIDQRLNFYRSFRVADNHHRPFTQTIVIMIIRLIIIRRILSYAPLVFIVNNFWRSLPALGLAQLSNDRHHHHHHQPLPFLSGITQQDCCTHTCPRN